MLISIALGVITYQQVVSKIVHPAHQSDLQSLWSQWKVQHGKAYSTAVEDSERFEIFTENHAKVQRVNSDSSYTYKLALNKFADLSGSEFSATFASCHKGELKGDGDAYCPSAVNCPAIKEDNYTVLNWTTSGAVTGVKNQGQCGSCWSFSTTGALEGLNFLTNKLLVSFSEQQLVSCATQCDACDGCWPYLAMEYAATAGIEPEKLYPYVSGNGDVPKCKYQSAAALKVNTGYQCIQQESSQQLFDALVQQPVSIAVEADQNAWQFYSSGVVNSECGAALDHAVLLVGFSNDESNGEAWYVKNSWGTDWGMSGYIWIGAGSAANQENNEYGMCGILRCATIPTN
jgi:cathepsin L